MHSAGKYKSCSFVAYPEHNLKFCNLVTFSRELVKKVNSNISWFTDRFVIGRDMALVKKIVKTAKLDQWKYKGRVKIG